LITLIREEIINRGIDSCFYSDFKNVVKSDDPDLTNDVDFFNYLAHMFKEVEYQLKSDKTKLQKVLKSDQSKILKYFLYSVLLLQFLQIELKIDSSLLPAYSDFQFKIATFEKKSDLEDTRLQLCHQIVLRLLVYSSSTHLILLFDRVSQMKSIDSTLSYLEMFNRDYIRPKEFIREKQLKLIEMEDNDKLNKALEEQAKIDVERIKEEAFDKGCKINCLT
jgi:hypothetical protein